MASSSFPFKTLQLQLSFFTHCKYSSSLNPFKFHCSFETITFSPITYNIYQPRFSCLEVTSALAPHLETTLSTTDTKHETNNKNGSFFSSVSSIDKRVNSFNSEEKIEKRVILKDKYAKNGLNSKNRGKNGSGNSFVESKDENLVRDNGKIKEFKFNESRGRNGSGNSFVKSKDEKLVRDNGKIKEFNESRGRNGSGNSFVKSKDGNLVRDNGKSKEFKFSNKKKEKEFKNGIGGEVEVEKMEKRSKKIKVEGPGTTLRIGLDLCSKRGDVVGAIKLYDLAKKAGVRIGQYHYGVLLYLCSSAATGVVQPAKSGNGGGRTLSPADSSNEISVDGPENLGESGKIGSRSRGTNEWNMQVMDDELHMYDRKLIVNGYADKVTMKAKDRGVGMEENLNSFWNGSDELYSQTLDGLVQHMKKSADNSKTKHLGGLQGGHGIQVSEDVKRYALQRGFEIYDKMRSEDVSMNEATLTSVARMAMSLGDGDMAFDMVKQMKELGINPRLRSYGPALSVFCNYGDVEKAFLVEEHMLEHGIYPEEPELEALLRVSMEASRSDKVYYLLHKLRTSVRQVSPSTADVIEKWFKSKVASRVGKRKWDQRLIAEAIENGGGGWHGQGWLGKGKWSISRTCVGSDGLCQCCGEKLVTIDLDPVETENFAKSVASLAVQREKNSSFQKFQKWLDYYGPFEAVVDGANVGLYSQRRFKPSKVNAVVNGIRQMLPSKKWPLIILHNRRITEDKMDEPVNKKLIEKWKNADALYATPTGSNDDWYWLYAAIKFKCLLVTNDEMRDHLFQLLGTDFFPKWKERHQVHFSFSETGPVFRMPPPCSVVIQESGKGHWHVPILSEFESDEERTWLCITRAHSLVAQQVSPSSHGESDIPGQKDHALSGSQLNTQVKLTPTGTGNQINSKKGTQETYKSLKTILSSSVFGNPPTILPELEAAEKVSGCVIDFQI